MRRARAVRSFFSSGFSRGGRWSWRRERRREAALWLWVFALGGAAAVAWAALFGAWARKAPERCAPKTRALGARCCPEGQALVEGQCRGQPKGCPEGLQLAVRPQLGCVASLEPARVAGGRLELAPNDWEAEGVVERRVVEVRSFRLDRTEVTVDAWRRCSAAGACDALPAPSSAAPAPSATSGQTESPAPSAPAEPGVPVTGITASQAERYCAFAGGRLPTFDELLFAAAGPDGRRFPWGPHGLVCRRASFGLEDGPCATGGTGPELAGSRPGGATPAGILDLVGNVAEWSRGPEGELRLFGGSYRSKVASQLKSWSSEPPRVGDDVGFRCAYDLPDGR